MTYEPAGTEMTVQELIDRLEELKQEQIVKGTADLPVRVRINPVVTPISLVAVCQFEDRIGVVLEERWVWKEEAV